MIKKVKIEDKEVNILVTYGISDSYKKLETNFDGSVNSVGYVFMEDYYSSRLCIHNNIIIKNQTILEYKEGESISTIEINQLLNKYKYDKV